MWTLQYTKTTKVRGCDVVVNNNVPFRDIPRKNKKAAAERALDYLSRAQIDDAHSFQFSWILAPQEHRKQVFIDNLKRKAT